MSETKKKTNVIYMHQVTQGNKYSFEFRMKHEMHVNTVIQRWHKVMDQTKYKKVL